MIKKAPQMQAGISLESQPCACLVLPSFVCGSGSASLGSCHVGGKEIGNHTWGPLPRQNAMWFWGAGSPRQATGMSQVAKP